MSTSLNKLAGMALRDHSTRRVVGVPIDWQLPDWIVVSPCFCVQDSPDNPCPCYDKEHPWVFIPKDGIVSERETGRKSEFGIVNEFAIDINAQVLVGLIKPLDARDIEDGDDVITAYKKKSVRRFLIGLAYKAGKVFGEWLDEETGASDDISDWLIDKFGEAPGWLKDLVDMF